MRRNSNASFQPPENRPVLLIDGNNLAHFLYTNLTPGQKMTPADSLRLVYHLSGYVENYQSEIQVELCLDRPPGELPEVPEGLRVLPAEYPLTGDDLLLGRFWFYHESGSQCLVITNDEEILEEVGEAGGAALRVYDFVRRAGLIAPVFRAPDELPPAIFQSITDDKSPDHPSDRPVIIRGSKRTSKAHPANAGLMKRGGSVEISLSTNEPVTQPKPAGNQTQEEKPVADQGETQKQPEHVVDPGPFYLIDLNKWPADEGARFLRNHFCENHRSEYKELIDSLDEDVSALAELLIYVCGEEPDFARQGSLMARVRLALLQSQGDMLSLRQLAERTGLKIDGLRKKIKERGEKWVDQL